MQTKFEQYVEFLNDNGFADNQLYNRSLLDHLISTYHMGKKLGCHEDICTVSLFHSIYEEISEYKFIGFSLSQRKKIANLVGNKNEQLIYMFWLSEYNGSLKDNILRNGNYFIIDKTNNNQEIYINLKMTKNLLEVSAINLIEQVAYALDNLLASKEELLKYIQPYTKANNLLSVNVYKEVLKYFQTCSL